MALVQLPSSVAWTTATTAAALLTTSHSTEQATTSSLSMPAEALLLCADSPVLLRGEPESSCAGSDIMSATHLAACIESWPCCCLHEPSLLCDGLGGSPLLCDGLGGSPLLCDGIGGLVEAGARLGLDIAEG